MKDLKEIVSAILKISQQDLGDQTPRTQIPEWDSFNHLMLISELESQLNITFTMEEVGSIHCFEALKKIVQGKTG